MEFDIRNIGFEENEWSVTKAISDVLHTYPGPFVSDPTQRPLNFKVTLNKGHSGVRNDGSGTLTLPSRDFGRQFIKWQKDSECNRIRVSGVPLKFFPNKTIVGRGLMMTLEKAPYIDPTIDQERQQRIWALYPAFRIATLQIGTYYRKYTSSPTAPRAFSIEWERHYTKQGLAWLSFNYDHKAFHIKLGDPMKHVVEHNVTVKFSSINKLAIGYDYGNQFICFDLLTPPDFEETDIHRSSEGDEKKANDKTRRRVSALHPGHAAIAPYAHHLRVILSEDGDLERFEQFCRVAELRRPIKGVNIEASGQAFFSSKYIAKVNRWLRGLDWLVAFQVEALLHNGLLSTVELDDLRAPIDRLVQEHRKLAGEILRYFTEALASRSPNETPRQCFDLVRHSKLKSKLRTSPQGRFFCHHVTFTPTRMLLEGPYIIQSNRVIRNYEGYEDHFIRVDFRDEDRLNYRWNRELDALAFLEPRVGGILKNGFELAGRDFEFLAYSSSALREHAVWFVNPFSHPTEGWVTSESIRSGLGDFSGVIFHPSKYAARMAQAFSATDPSVKIHKSQWREIPDLGDETTCFTDGVGTISRELGDMIWGALCEARRDHGEHTIKPSAYQIRFLGYKGMVAIDAQLTGVQMCLRPSMNKFLGKETEYAEIEIARAFERPNLPHLNRPLVMVLEDRGAKRDSFVKLQDEVIAETRMANDSIERFRSLLEEHNLGHNFRLSPILQQLNALGLELKADQTKEAMDSPFLAQTRSCAINHVLRSVKHEARIQIPKSYMLVGVADEGPAYVNAGRDNVFCLPEGKIYACVQKPGDMEPIWLEGLCVISRSPVIHPGDVQRVYAIGKPPANKLCLFSHLKNVVVLPSVGARSLASCLGGGDLDGDLYEVIQHSPFLVTEHHDPAEYPAGSIFTLDRPSTIEDVCDFVVEYIHSDVVGLVSDKHIVIADQSKHGTLDQNCLKLSALHSQAVDYPKNGIKVDISFLPRSLIPYKPDWHAAEVDSPRKTDYYESSRALGYLYRNITLEDLPTSVPRKPYEPLDDPISKVLKPRVKRQTPGYTDPDGESSEMETIFQTYRDELNYISVTHSLTNIPGARLREDEIVVGTILSKCSQKRWRSDRMYRMKAHASFLAHETRRDIRLLDTLEDASEGDIRKALLRAWTAWDLSLRKSDPGPDEAHCFGAHSFGLIALGIVLDCLEKLGSL
ncbi:hypothetical protein SERLA73DRAFT_162413 [Serpula lacrymans var. lacrymans S7.3]|uniref:RNA-dependent RNA polymerase n=2 Tax=Serpula lacrymans var. lacrymans TaxID=341189 RepID=F8Q7R0_SERL3|nr:uncharacterized protein SERLADRAFT_417518 [Serpula lacrymans var. lacrymans S7.9]EGN95598.1 hypothetical protein SERLA73DRAFT_162413 [Serpula lacrymans var. lacrymans S7.3]EGO21129.1 hypothetical protein SERLADRAFT_417518 [Serpula lacrymans var. lacrymans S7.9]